MNTHAQQETKVTREWVQQYQNVTGQWVTYRTDRNGTAAAQTLNEARAFRSDGVWRCVVRETKTTVTETLADFS